MVALYLFLVGTYLYYCKSKYFPSGIYKWSVPYATWLAIGCFLIGTGVYVWAEGWTSGLLLALCALSLAAMLVQITAVFGKTYFYGLVAVAHCLLLIALLV